MGAKPKLDIWSSLIGALGLLGPKGQYSAVHDIDEHNIRAFQILLLKYIRLQTPLPEYYSFWVEQYPQAAIFCEEFWQIFRAKVFYFRKVGVQSIFLSELQKYISQEIQQYTE